MPRLMSMILQYYHENAKIIAHWIGEMSYIMANSWMSVIKGTSLSNNFALLWLEGQWIA